MQDQVIPPSGESSPTPAKRWSLTLHRKEFKSKPELKIEEHLLEKEEHFIDLDIVSSLSQRMRLSV